MTGCPVCDWEGALLLKIEQPPEMVLGEYWVYECPRCKERFTTTESDAMSIKNLGLRRKD